MEGNKDTHDKKSGDTICQFGEIHECDRQMKSHSNSCTVGRLMTKLIVENSFQNEKWRVTDNENNLNKIKREKNIYNVTC